MSGKKGRKKQVKQPTSPGETTSFVEEGTRIVSAVYRMHDAEAFRKPLKPGNSMYKEYTDINSDPIFLGQIYRKLQEKPCPYRSFEDVNSDLERLWDQEERFYKQSSSGEKKKAGATSTPVQKRYRQLQAVKNYYEVMAKPILSGHVELTGGDDEGKEKGSKNKDGTSGGGSGASSEDKSSVDGSGSTGSASKEGGAPGSPGSGKKKKKKKKVMIRDSDEAAMAAEDTKDAPSKGLSRRKTDLTDVVDLTVDEEEATLSVDIDAVRSKYKPLRLKVAGGRDDNDEPSSKTVEKTESQSKSPSDELTDSDKKESSQPSSSNRKSVSFSSPKSQSKPSPVNSPLSAMKKMATKRTLKFLADDEQTPANEADEDTKSEPPPKRRRTVFRLSVWKRDALGKEEIKQLYRTGFSMNDAVRSLMKEQDPSKVRLERVEKLTF